MTDLRDPMALVRHAVQVGDWRLLDLLAPILAGRGAAHRAYGTLVLRLGLRDVADYDRC